MRDVCRFLAFVALIGGTARAIAGADDAKSIQGDWEIAELVVAGKVIPIKDIAGLRFSFKDSILTISPKALPDLTAAPTAATGAFASSLVSAYARVVVDRRPYSFKLDSAKKPATVDLTALDGVLKGTVSPGIYELKGDTLRWCQSDDEKSKDRPKDFKSPEKSRIYSFTFKRVK